VKGYAIGAADAITLAMAGASELSDQTTAGFLAAMAASSTRVFGFGCLGLCRAERRSGQSRARARDKGAP